MISKVKSKEEILDEQHWKFDDYKQRLQAKEWKKLLLNNDDKIIYKGKVTSLICDKLGYGVVEVYKNPSELRKDF